MAASVRYAHVQAPVGRSRRRTAPTYKRILKACAVKTFTQFSDLESPSFALHVHPAGDDGVADELVGSVGVCSIWTSMLHALCTADDRA